MKITDNQLNSLVKEFRDKVKEGESEMWNFNNYKYTNRKDLNSFNFRWNAILSTGFSLSRKIHTSPKVQCGVCISNGVIIEIDFKKNKISNL